MMFLVLFDSNHNTTFTSSNVYNILFYFFLYIYMLERERERENVYGIVISNFSCELYSTNIDTQM